jgi:hypothetical protein
VSKLSGVLNRARGDVAGVSLNYQSAQFAGRTTWRGGQLLEPPHRDAFIGPTMVVIFLPAIFLPFPCL